MTLDGYSVAYVTKVPGNLHCALCRTVLDKPVQASCGDRFHQPCFKSLFRECENPICPTCKEKLDKRISYRDVFADKELMELEVFCCMKPAGCDWSGEHRLLQKHIDTCSYTLVACSNPGCLAEVTKSELQQHVDIFCDFRFVNCPYCNETMTAKELTDHISSCLKAPVICPNECEDGKTMNRENLASHMEICPKKVVTCNIVGCNFKGQQHELNAHAEASLPLHLSCLGDCMKQLQLEVKDFDCKIDDKIKDQIQSLKKPAVHDSMSSDSEQKLSALEDQLREFESRQTFMQQKTIAACYESVDNIQKQFKTKVDLLDQHMRLMTEKCIKFEETISMQDVRMKQLESELSQYRLNGGTNVGLQQQFRAQDRVLASHDMKLAEHGLRLDMIDCKNTNGVLLWKITDIRRRRIDAVSGKTPSIYSQPFYTSPNGYKMCARLYLNGDGMGRGTHLSLFFVIMRGEYDSLLPWPFRQKVTLILTDQQGGNHVSDTFRPDPTSLSFQRPRNEMNVASGCPLFVLLATLDSNGYVKDDTLFIKIAVDLTNVIRPDAS
ncbi:TNF receptor-associated factor 3-like isoform X2 [Corticium candelabrum]|uniref:TNF receptor-associated factor 3-like isoform X2 n=1 Tax=Corticium candelabrum TaxID=121492 RepID=UPI002E262805|nr:TNF receptor-associated factor 3-like isoform X2 [Corticium candelabrum]